MKKLSLKESQGLQIELMKQIHNVCEINGITYYLIAGSCLGAIRHGGFIPWDDDIDIGMMRSDYEKFIQVFSSSMNEEKYHLQNYRTEPKVHFALSRICIKGTYYYNEKTEKMDINHSAYIDLFPLDNVPDNSISRKIQHYCYYLLKLLIVSRTQKFQKKKSIIFFSFMRLIAKLFPLNTLHKYRDYIMSLYKNNQTKCVCSIASKYSHKKQTISRKIYGNPHKVKFEDTYFNVPENTDAYLRQLYGKNYMQLPPVEKRVEPHPIFIE